MSEQERRAAMAERVRAYRARQRAEDAAGYRTTGAATGAATARVADTWRRARPADSREPVPPPVAVATTDRGATLLRATDLILVAACCEACDRLVLAGALVRRLTGWRCADAAGCAAAREGRGVAA